MKKILTIATLPLLAIVLSACATFSNDLVSVAGVVTGLDETSILETAVVQEGLAGVLADETAEFTVFAPTNDAFAAFLDDAGLTAADLLALGALDQVLRYHVVSGTFTSADVVAAVEAADPDPFTVTTVQGGTIDITVEDGDVTLTDATGTSMTVVDPDKLASNGVVHLIDYVLFDAAFLP